MSIVKVTNRNERIIPVRYDMLDIRKGTATLFELFEFDDSRKFEKEIFRHEKLKEN